MCGIIGCVGRGAETLDVLVAGLSRLDYRGYDSAGVALANGHLDVCKRAGKLETLQAALEGRTVDGTVGIGHTRWSTHGPPTDANAHPHLDCEGRVAVVHNGIIENYHELREELSGAGHAFESDTDTEVLPHLVEDALAEGLGPEAAVRAAVDRLEGSYAIAVVIADVDAVFGARHDSPLVLGLAEDATYLASDVPAFREYTDRVVYLDDDEFARIDASGRTVTDVDGTPVEKAVDVVTWDPEDTGKSGYDHYMLKEIHEQPRALRQCLRGRVDELNARVTLDGIDGLGGFSGADRVEGVSAVDGVSGVDGVSAVSGVDGDDGVADRGIQFVACGTSYHAALYGEYLFRAAGVPAQAFIASEYATSPPPVGEDLVVGVSQSGETADTLAATREARKRGGETLALTNTVGSTMARECDHALYIRSGPEIGVAATKTFAGQQTALNLLSLATVEGLSRDVIAALRDLPGDVQAVLDDSIAAEVAHEYVDADAFFFIGRALAYPVALEGALKMKEISYGHAEGFAAGELKHGPLALVTGNTPVFAVVLGEGEYARKTVGNVKEVEARDTPVVAVTDGQSTVERYADRVLRVPASHPRTAAVLANVQLQLVAYHVADELGRPIDKPRHLAKSVTVE